MRCGAKAPPGGGRLRRCAGCARARYCGAACQEADWALHKPACAVLKRGPLGRWRVGPGGQHVWEPSEAALAAAAAEAAQQDVDDG